MIAVTIECKRCHKDFVKQAAQLEWVQPCWRAFSHCDGCEAALKAAGMKKCEDCSPRRQGPYMGEPHVTMIPLFSLGKSEYLEVSIKQMPYIRTKSDPRLILVPQPLVGAR